MDILCAPRRYVAGVDGGGTKTACMIADESGTLLAYAVTEGSNHQISGFSLAIENDAGSCYNPSIKERSR